MLATWVKRSTTEVRSYVYCTLRPWQHVSVFVFVFVFLFFFFAWKRLKTPRPLNVAFLSRFCQSAQKRNNDWKRYLSVRSLTGVCTFSGICASDAIVFQNLRFQPSSRVQLNGVFKNLHSGLRFLDTSGRGRTAHLEFENSNG